MAIPLAPEVEAACKKARQMVKARQFTEACLLLENELVQNDDSVPVLEVLAFASYSQKDFQRAAECYRRLAELQPYQAGPLVNLGAICNCQGDFQGAIKACRTALTKDRKCASAFYNMGLAQKGLHQPAMAITAYRQAIQLDPKMADAHYNLANLLLDMGSLQQAIVSFEKALEARPDFERARHGLKRAFDARNASLKERNAFGRLVNDQDSLQHQDEPEYRLLTEDERAVDRKQLTELTQGIESLSHAVVRQLRDDLTPVLHKLHQAMMRGGPGPGLQRELEAYSLAHTRLNDLSQALQCKLRDLRTHEQEIRD